MTGNERKPKRAGARFATYNIETEKTDCCDAYMTYGGGTSPICRWCYQEVDGYFEQTEAAVQA